jgi:hypothetical protein
LPRYLGDLSPGLVRIGEPAMKASSGLRVLTHEDLRRTARVRALAEFTAEAFARRRYLLEGK